jgi:glutathionyl-hydroquinone reductase
VIDEVNALVYHYVNNGVYRAGFASSQEPHDATVDTVFARLDWLDERPAQRRFLVGAQITEAHTRLFATFVRFDAVYVGHLKCNLLRLADYSNLWGMRATSISTTGSATPATSTPSIGTAT